MVRSEAERCTSVCGALRRATPGRLGLSHAAPRHATPRHAAPRHATPRRRAKAAALCTVQCTLHGASYHAEQIGLDPFIEGCWTHRLPWCTVQVCRESLRMPLPCLLLSGAAGFISAACESSRARDCILFQSMLRAACYLLCRRRLHYAGSARAARCIAHAVSVCPQQRSSDCLLVPGTRAQARPTRSSPPRPPQRYAHSPRPQPRWRAKSDPARTQQFVHSDHGAASADHWAQARAVHERRHWCRRNLWHSVVRLAVRKCAETIRYDTIRDDTRRYDTIRDDTIRFARLVRRSA